MRPRWGHRSIISDHFCNRILCESMSRRLRAAPRSPFCCARAAAIQCLLHEAAAPHCAPSPPCQRSNSQRRPQSGYLGLGCDAGAASPPSRTTQQARCSVSEAAHEDQHGQLQPQHSKRWSSGTIVGSVALGRHNTTGGTIATKRGRSLSTPFSHSATRAHVAAQSTASASIPALGTEPQPPRRDRVGVHTKTQQVPSPASHSAQLSQRSAHACAGGTAAVPHLSTSLRTDERRSARVHAPDMAQFAIANLLPWWVRQTSAASTSPTMSVSRSSQLQLQLQRSPWLQTTQSQPTRQLPSLAQRLLLTLQPIIGTSAVVVADLAAVALIRCHNGGCRIHRV